MDNAAMDDAWRRQLVPGTRVKVVQQVAARNRTYATEVTGTVLDYRQKPTGSWFAHARNDKLWLDRLKLKLADGELMTLNLDEYSRIEVLTAPAAGAAPAAEAPQA